MKNKTRNIHDYDIYGFIHKNVLVFWAGDMAQRGKAFAAKPDNLCLIP